MERALGVASLLLLLAGCGGEDAPKGPVHALKWKVKTGDVFTIGMKSTTNSSTTGMAPRGLEPLTQPLHSKIVATLKLTVGEEREPGTWDLTLEPVSITFTGRVADAEVDAIFQDGKWEKEKIRFTKPYQDKDRRRDALKAAMLKGARGQLRSFAMRGVEGAGFVMVGAVFQSFPWLPKKSIPEGETWNQKAPMGTYASSKSMGEVQMKNTLQSITEGIASIDTALDHAFKDQGKDHTLTRNRRGEFDIEGGYYTRLVDDFKTTLTDGEFKFAVNVVTELVVERK